MTEAVNNIGNEIKGFTLLATKETIYGIDNHFDDVDVLPLVETTDVVSLCNGTFVENEVDSACMILHKKPVTNILTSTVYREWLTMTNIVDEERNQLLWKLVRTVVVRAVGHDSRHTVGIVKSTNEMI